MVLDYDIRTKRSRKLLQPFIQISEALLDPVRECDLLQPTTVCRCCYGDYRVLFKFICTAYGYTAIRKEMTS